MFAIVMGAEGGRLVVGPYTLIFSSASARLNYWCIDYFSNGQTWLVESVELDDNP